MNISCTTILSSAEALLLPFRGSRRWVAFSQIVRLEGIGNYTTCVFADGSRLLVALTLKRLHDRMPPGAFLRLHRKHLVNRGYVATNQPDEYWLRLTNGDRVAVARRRAETVLRETQPVCLLIS
jgi:two-component system, LytTR family, response regulator